MVKTFRRYSRLCEGSQLPENLERVPYLQSSNILKDLEYQSLAAILEVPSKILQVALQLLQDPEVGPWVLFRYAKNSRNVLVGNQMEWFGLAGNFQEKKDHL